MTAPTYEATGGFTVNRKWIIEVDVSATSTPEWEPVTNIAEFKQSTPLTTQDVSDFQSPWKRTVATAVEWVIALKFNRALIADGSAYPAAQEALLACSRTTGTENRAHIRTYELVPASTVRPDAWEGYMTVTADDGGGDYAATSSVSLTLNGQGEPNKITHPYA